jgi:hypothetical protein
MSYLPYGTPLGPGIAASPYVADAEGSELSNQWHLVAAAIDIDFVAATTGQLFPLYTLKNPQPYNSLYTWQFFPTYFAAISDETYSGNLNTPQINVGFQSSSNYAEFVSNQNLTKPQGGALSGMFASGQFDLFGPRAPAAGQKVLVTNDTTIYVRVNVKSDATKDVRTIAMWGYIAPFYIGF